MGFSGKFVVRIPPSLHARLRDVARSLGLSLNALCVRALSDAVRSGTGELAATAAEDARWGDLAVRFARAKRVGILGTVLFGSAARGELRPGSDIDLLVVLGEDAPLSRGLYRSWDEWLNGEEAGREVNAQFVHLPRTVDDAGSLWLETAIEGVVLGDEGGLVARFLAALRRAVASGRFKRSVVHGQPCWLRAS